MRFLQVLGKKQRMIIALILAALCVLFAVLGIRGMRSGGSISSPNGAKHGVVWIYETLVDGGGNYNGASGTGFLIGEKGKDPQYVVTNAHVVEDYYQVKQGTSEYFYAAQLEVYFSAAENDSVLPQIVYISPSFEKDIAILKLPKPTSKRAPLAIRASDTVTPGSEEVFAIGYPGISAQTQDYVTYDEDDATLTRGVISKLTSSQTTTVPMFELDAVLNHGNSGGPLVDQKGNVIGINESISQETVLGVDAYGNVTTVPISNDLGYAITSNELIKVLDSEGIPYMKAGSGVSVGGILLLVLAALAGLCAVMTLLAGGKASPSPVRPLNAARGASTAGSAPYGGAAGAAAGTAAAGAAQTAAAYGVAKKPSLRGLTGQYAGKSIPIGDGALTIGRNGQICNVVFDKDTPGVSGNHCSIVYDRVQDVYVLTDNGSTYGTFLGNGRKLAAGVPERLRDGDLFYLANKNIRFLVTKE